MAMRWPRSFSMGCRRCGEKTRVRPDAAGVSFLHEKGLRHDNHIHRHRSPSGYCTRCILFGPKGECVAKKSLTARLEKFVQAPLFHAHVYRDTNYAGP